MSEEDPILPRKEPVQARSKKRFSRILEEATHLMDTKGVDAVAMSQIAEKSEISIASLYQYFPDKAAIVATLAQRLFDDGQQQMQQIWDQAADRDGFLHAVAYMIDCYHDCFRNVPGAYSIWQATQSDKRLLFLDVEDCAAHADMFATAMVRVAPDTRDQAGSYAKTMSILVAAAVRTAASAPHAEGAEQLRVFKEKFVTPSLLHQLKS